MDNSFLQSVEKGNLQAVKEFLDHKNVDPNTTNASGTSALFIAINHKHRDIILELLEAGADPYLENNYGISPIKLANQDNHYEALSLIGQFKDQIKKKKKEPMFHYQKGDSTKRVHLEYKAYCKSHGFEHQFYHDTIDLLQEEIIHQKEKLRSGDLGGANEHANEALSDIKVKAISGLEGQAKKPYYARLDIKQENGEVESIYIGANGMKDDRVYPPQSRYGGLYAQRKIGKQHDQELGDIEVSLIRQVENENGQILDIIDQEWSVSEGYVDPILMKRLNDKAKAKMNEIWETIQAEQDQVIRQGIDKPVIVQGSAGSGKTIIALHRLSFLLYEHKNQLEEHKVMVMGPNLMYLKYIQQALPHLNVGHIKQSSFASFCEERLPFKREKYELMEDQYDTRESLTDKQVKFSEMKGSLAYKDALTQFLGYNLEIFLPDNGLLVIDQGEEFSFPRKKIKELFQQYFSRSTVQKSKERVVDLIKSEAKSFITKWRNDEDSLDKEQLRKKINAKIKTFESKWKVPGVFDIYYSFATDKTFLREHLGEEVTPYIDSFVRQNKKQKDKKQVSSDDLAALLSVQKYMHGKVGVNAESDPMTITNQKYHYLIIDEVQDYSPYQLATLKDLVVRGRLMILGDLGQSIYDFRGINEWNHVHNALDLLEKNHKYMELSTIYRSTIQIVNFANQIIRPYSDGRYSLSEPVGRDGTEPMKHEFSESQSEALQIGEQISNLLENGMKSIALITKDGKEAVQIHQELQNEYPDMKLITDANTEFEGGIIVTPVHLSKGIEYDSVILTNASLNQYGDDDYSRKLLYVAVTRALHSVDMFYKDTLALPLLDIIDPDAAKQVRDENVNEEEEQEEIKAFPDTPRSENHKDFVQDIGKQIEVYLDRYNDEIERLQKRVKELETQLADSKQQKPESKRTSDIHKEAYYNYFLQQANETNVQEYLEYIHAYDTSDSFKVILNTLKDLIQKKNMPVVKEVLETIQLEILKENPIENIDVIELCNTVISIPHVIEESFEQMDDLLIQVIEVFRTLKIHPQQDQARVILEEAGSFLEALIDINDADLALSGLQLFLEYNNKANIEKAIKRLFVEWEFFEHQLNSQHLTRLLWYAFIVNKDEALMGLAREDILNLPYTEVSLYKEVYDYINGEVDSNDIMEGFFNRCQLFSEAEIVVLKDYVYRERDKLSQEEDLYSTV